MSEHEPTTVHVDEADPQAGSTFVVAGVSTALLVAIILILEVVHTRVAEAEHYRKEVAPESEELLSLDAEQLQRLQGGAWVDREAGVVTIPIEKAMQIVVEENGR